MGCPASLLRAVPALLAAAGVLAGSAGAQVPYRLFDDSTQVASIDFRFPRGRTLETSVLRDEMSLTAPGALAGLRRALDFLPFVPGVGFHPFTPLELQRDVARLRALYSGFVGTAISYEVEYDEPSNTVDVLMIVDEGRPITIRSIDIVSAPDGGEPARVMPPELRPEWIEFVAGTQLAIGRPHTQEGLTRQVSELLTWWRDRGWAFSRADVDLQVDSAAAAADLLFTVEPGPRARVGEVTIEGNVAVSEELIRRSLPLEPSDWYSASAMAEGQRRIFGLELFRLVLVNTPRDQPRDSTVDILVRVQEGAQRLISGQLGYVSSGGGITGGGELTHHNFLGGGRTLRVDAVAQTGAFAVGSRSDREYRLSATYRRPFTFNPRFSLSLGPYGQYRDNVIDRSWEVGLTSTLLYELERYSYVTLQHRFSSRRVLDYRLGTGDSIDLLELLRLVGAGALDTLENRIDNSVVALSATLGRFDPTRARNALQVRPLIETTFPAPLNTIEYVRLELPMSLYLPLGDGYSLTGRAQLGRVYPFGKTLAGDSVAGLLQSAQLRDVLLTTGGTATVRGWGNGLVGPKTLNLVFTPQAGDSIAVRSTEYIPAGGLARASGSVELRMPFPGLSDTWGTHLFLDAGRVWTPDRRFRAGQDVDNGWFFGIGFGVSVSTIVGPVRVSLGYKLNPSPLDLRDPREVFQAITNGLPLGSVDPAWSRRLHLHVSLGQAL